MVAYRAVVLTLALALCGCVASAAQPEEVPLHAPSLAAADPATVVDARVSRAVDGTTLDAHVADRRTLVGYLGVETPYPTQPCGQEALARNRELAGTQVFLEDDPAYLFDDRGRRLAYAYTADGVSIDETLVREGLAWAVRTDARYGAYLAAVQAEAEAAGHGCLWGRADTP